MYVPISFVRILILLSHCVRNRWLLLHWVEKEFRSQALIGKNLFIHLALIFHSKLLGFRFVVQALWTDREVSECIFLSCIYWWVLQELGLTLKIIEVEIIISPRRWSMLLPIISLLIYQLVISDSMVQAGLESETFDALHTCCNWRLLGFQLLEFVNHSIFFRNLIAFFATIKWGEMHLNFGPIRFFLRLWNLTGENALCSLIQF